MLTQYCKAKSINMSDIMKPEFQNLVMRKYGFKDWDSVLAAIGHGGLKEGQVINKMMEEREKSMRRSTRRRSPMRRLWRRSPRTVTRS